VIDLAQVRENMGYQEMVRYSGRFDDLISDMMTECYFEDIITVLADRLGECLRIHKDKQELWEFLKGIVESRAKLKEH
jgi:hypothetical protein